MRRPTAEFTKQFLAQARHSLEKHHLPRVTRCLQMLPDGDMKWMYVTFAAAGWKASAARKTAASTSQS